MVLGNLEKKEPLGAGPERLHKGGSAQMGFKGWRAEGGKSHGRGL